MTGDMDIGDALNRVIDALDSVRPDFAAEDLTLEERVYRLDIVLRSIAVLIAMRAALEVELVDSIPGKEAIVGSIRAKRGTRTNSAWKPDGSNRMQNDITVSVADRIATDIETGEIDRGKRNIAVAAAREVFDIIYAPSNIKKAPAFRYGLRIDDYRTFDEIDIVTLEHLDEP